MPQMSFQYASAVIRKARNEAINFAKIAENSETMSYNEAYDMKYNSVLERGMRDFEDILNYAEALDDIYQNRKKQWYFITIRPDVDKVSFADFTAKVDKFIKRKCIGEWTLTYEQVGKSLEDLGKGFHVHIVCSATWRSKGKCVEDTVSSFNKICIPSAIKVGTTHGPDALIQNYFIDYNAEDEHKIETKEWDALWRNANNIKPLYTKKECQSVSCLPVNQVQVTGNKSVNVSWD